MEQGHPGLLLVMSVSPQLILLDPGLLGAQLRLAETPVGDKAGGEGWVIQGRKVTFTFIFCSEQTST